jgi:hypothetical protein
MRPHARVRPLQRAERAPAPAARCFGDLLIDEGVLARLLGDERLDRCATAGPGGQTRRVRRCAARGARVRGRRAGAAAPPAGWAQSGVHGNPWHGRSHTPRRLLARPNSAAAFDRALSAEGQQSVKQVRWQAGWVSFNCAAARPTAAAIPSLNATSS